MKVFRMWREIWCWTVRVCSCSKFCGTEVWRFGAEGEIDFFSWEGGQFHVGVNLISTAVSVILDLNLCRKISNDCYGWAKTQNLFQAMRVEVCRFISELTFMSGLSHHQNGVSGVCIFTPKSNSSSPFRFPFLLVRIQIVGALRLLYSFLLLQSCCSDRTLWCIHYAANV